MAVELMAVALKLAGGLSGTVKCMVFVNANEGIEILLNAPLKFMYRVYTAPLYSTYCKHRNFPILTNIYTN